MTQTAKSEPRESYHHGDLKGALIRATQTLIEEKGIDHFSVSDACRLAGVSTAAPYKHFKNKDEMIQAAMLAAMMGHGSELHEALSAHPKGTIARIVAMGENYIDYAAREPQMFRLRFADFGCSLSEDVHKAGDQIYSVVLEEIRAVLGEPEINERVISRGYLLWSLVHGMSYLGMVPHFAKKHPATPRTELMTDIARRVLSD